MRCGYCGGPLVPYGSPGPRGQMFACLSHRGYGAYEGELRQRGHSAAVDAAASEANRRADEGREQYARDNGFSSWGAMVAERSVR